MADALRLRFPSPLLLLLLLATLIAATAARADDDLRMSVLAGGVVSLSTEAETAVEPMARVSVTAPLTDDLRAPELLVDVDLGALPGKALELQDPQTFNSAEVRVGIGWKPWDSARFGIYGAAGFATKLPADPEPRERTARWAELGLRLADYQGNAISVGGGLDERLDGTYQPALMVSGSVRLGEASAGKFAIGALLVGRAILGVDFGQAVSARRDVVQIAVAASVGSGDR